MGLCLTHGQVKYINKRTDVKHYGKSITPSFSLIPPHKQTMIMFHDYQRHKHPSAYNTMAAASPSTAAATPALSWWAAAVTTGSEVAAVWVVPLPPSAEVVVGGKLAVGSTVVVSSSGIEVLGTSLAVGSVVAVSWGTSVGTVLKLGGRSTPFCWAQVSGSRPWMIVLGL